MCIRDRPRRLEETEKRLFALKAAARKYDVSVDALITQRAQFAVELDAVDSVVVNIEAARQKAGAAQAAYDKAAKRLSKARQKAAKSLDSAVAIELPPLKMERAQFKTDIQTVAPTMRGVDQVSFLVSTNPGTAIGPLQKIASGGEMARFCLLYTSPSPRDLSTSRMPSSA